MGRTTLLILALAIPTCLFLLAFIVGCRERHVVRTFFSAAVDSFPSYLRLMVERALANNFIYCDCGHHAKYKQNMTAALVLSPDRCTLAVIAEGTIARLPFRQTILMSQFRDGSYLFTSDLVGSAELDPQTRRQILMKATFDEMATKHMRLLAEGIPPVPFPEPVNFATQHEIFCRRTDRIVAQGLAVYLDPEHEWYRYTMRGSFQASILHGLKQTFRPTNIVRHHKIQPG
jgi:hypothetical protein